MKWFEWGIALFIGMCIPVIGTALYMTEHFGNRICIAGETFKMTCMHW